MALELKKRIELTLAIQIPAVKLLQGPSLKQIAAWILAELAGVPGFTGKDMASQHPCLVPIQTNGKNRPFFCVHGAMGYALAYTDLAKHLGQQQPFYGFELLSYLQQRYNGISQAILDEPELLKLFLPTIRADLTLLETTSYVPGELLTCPITAFGGREDPGCNQIQLQAWQEQTRGTFTMHLFPGDHFYLRQVQAQLLSIITHKWLSNVGSISR